MQTKVQVCERRVRFGLRSGFHYLAFVTATTQVSFGRDLERHFDFFVDCRAAFDNLDAVKERARAFLVFVTRLSSLFWLDLPLKEWILFRRELRVKVPHGHVGAWARTPHAVEPSHSH
eukprot:2440523-Pleurochrysis_carterae.AAC.1